MITMPFLTCPSFLTGCFVPHENSSNLSITVSCTVLDPLESKVSIICKPLCNESMVSIHNKLLFFLLLKEESGFLIAAK